MLNILGKQKVKEKSKVSFYNKAVAVFGEEKKKLSRSISL